MKHHNSAANPKNANSQYQNFAHLLYRQGARPEPNHPNAGITGSGYKYTANSMSYGNNTRTVPVTSFPNGRVTTMLQNSYSNHTSQPIHFPRTKPAPAPSNYRVQGSNRMNAKQGELSSSSFTRSKSVFKDQEWARNGISGSRSTASHSSGVKVPGNPHSKINPKVRMSSNSSGRTALTNEIISQNSLTQPYNKNIDSKLHPPLKQSGRGNERTWTLKGSGVSSKGWNDESLLEQVSRSEYLANDSIAQQRGRRDNSDFKKTAGNVSTGDFSYKQSNDIPKRPDSKRLNSLGRPPSSKKFLNPPKEIVKSNLPSKPGLFDDSAILSG